MSAILTNFSEPQFPYLYPNIPITIPPLPMDQFYCESRAITPIHFINCKEHALHKCKTVFNIMIDHSLTMEYETYCFKKKKKKPLQTCSCSGFFFRL